MVSSIASGVVSILNPRRIRIEASGNREVTYVKQRRARMADRGIKRARVFHSARKSLVGGETWEQKGTAVGPKLKTRGREGGRERKFPNGTSVPLDARR